MVLFKKVHSCRPGLKLQKKLSLHSRRTLLKMKIRLKYTPWGYFLQICSNAYKFVQISNKFKCVHFFLLFVHIYFEFVQICLKRNSEGCTSAKNAVFHNNVTILCWRRHLSVSLFVSFLKHWFQFIFVGTYLYTPSIIINYFPKVPKILPSVN